MDELSRVSLDSKRTTVASMAIVALVVYLAMIHLKSILMPLAIAILLYFMIKPPEQIIYNKLQNRFLSYGTVLLIGVITVYFISIFLYDNLAQFVDDVPEITSAFEEKRQKYADADLYGLEVIFSNTDIRMVLFILFDIDGFGLSVRSILFIISQ